MTEPIEHRVTRLEFRVDAHDTDLTTIKEDSKTMSETLKSMKDNLLQIKWIAAGAAGAFVVQQVGIVEVARKLLHL
jgi:hypothetical protein